MNYDQIRYVYSLPCSTPFFRRFTYFDEKRMNQYEDQSAQEKRYEPLPAVSIAYKVYGTADHDPVIYAGYSIRSPKNQWSRAKGRILAEERMHSLLKTDLTTEFQIAFPVMPVLSFHQYLPFLECISRYVNLDRIGNPAILSWNFLDLLTIKHIEALNIRIHQWELEADEDIACLNLLNRNSLHFLP